MGQVHFELLDFLFKVDLIEEKLRHFFSYLALSRLSLAGDLPLSLLSLFAISLSQWHLIVLVIFLILLLLQLLLLLMMLLLKCSTLHLVRIFRGVHDGVSWLEVWPLLLERVLVSKVAMLTPRHLLRRVIVHRFS